MCTRQPRARGKSLLQAIAVVLLLALGTFARADDLKIAKAWKDVIADENVTARRAIVRVLGRTGTEDNLFLVVGAMTDSDQSVRQLARDTMRKNKGPAGFHALERSLLDGNAWEIGLLLTRYTERKYVTFLCNDLRHKNATVRSVSVFALSRQGAKQALPIIKTMEDDPVEGVRWEVMNALKRYDSGK